MSGDTDASVEAWLDAQFAARTSDERLRMAAPMFDDAVKLVMADVRSREPDLTSAQLQLRVLERFYREEFSESE
jgi:hypothetical protein